MSETSDLVVACIEDHPKAMLLLRTARLLAQSRGGRWGVMIVETPGHFEPGQDESQERLLRLMTLAKQMGAESFHIEAESVEKGVMQMLDKAEFNPRVLVIGSIEDSSWFSRWRSAPWDRIARLAEQRHIAVERVPLITQQENMNWQEIRQAVKPKSLVYAVLTVFAAYLSAAALKWILPPALFRINDQNIALIFMIASAFSAGRFGLLPGLVASVAGFLTVNYFFTLPYYAVKVATITDILNMTLFLSAAILISLFTSQTRGYAEKAARRELSTQALFTLYRIASDASSREAALLELRRKLAGMLQMEVAFFLPSATKPDMVEPAHHLTEILTDIDMKALELCWKEMKTTGLASPFHSASNWRFEPMLAPGGEIGVIGVYPGSSKRLDTWFGRLLAAIADQTAAILEHMELELSMEETRIREEREKLRSMLLSSVSHDLKTPIASIIAALRIYRSQGKRLDAEKQQLLIDTALEETERLDSFITNILDMTRLESGNIEFKKEWQSMEDLAAQLMKRMEYRLRHHPLTIRPYPEKIEVHTDVMMTGQVLQNLLDNACKYTPVGTKIEISFRKEEEGDFFCDVRDFGPGLPANPELLFDKYTRMQRKDSKVAGTGLGLAICKAMMEAQGSGIMASSHPEGGAVFTLQFPEWRKSQETKYVA